MEEILNSYYENGANKLHSLVKFIVNKKFGGIQNKRMNGNSLMKTLII